MSESETLRTVSVDRLGTARYAATNARGGRIEFGSGTGDDTDFTPVELLLAAIGGCTSIDDEGSRMENLAVTFHVEFPEGPEGDRARAILPRAVRLSHDRLCTVSRTVELGTPITSTVAED
jgi:putative redox protein